MPTQKLRRMKMPEMLAQIRTKERKQRCGRTLEKMKMLKAYSESQAQSASERMKALAITKG